MNNLFIWLILILIFYLRLEVQRRNKTTLTIAIIDVTWLCHLFLQIVILKREFNSSRRIFNICELSLKKAHQRILLRILRMRSPIGGKAICTFRRIPPRLTRAMSDPLQSCFERVLCGLIFFIVPFLLNYVF